MNYLTVVQQIHVIFQSHQQKITRQKEGNIYRYQQAQGFYVS